MDTGNELRSAVKNIRYYSEKVKELAKLQLDKDFTVGTILGINTDIGSTRFENLGAMHSAADWLETYCDNIEANLVNAEKQDDKLRLPNEKGEENMEEVRTPEEFR